MKYILSLDQGTTSSRSIIFNEKGEVTAFAQEEFPQIFPQPGWVEHDPEAIWASQYRTAKTVLSRAGLEASEISAIGITNQRETALVWERSTGHPVANAIVWQCRRTSAICSRLREDGLEREISERTGLIIDPYFQRLKNNLVSGKHSRSQKTSRKR